MMTPLPMPNFTAAWARALTEWLNRNLVQREQEASLDLPGRITIAVANLPLDGDLPATGGLYNRADYSLLFKRIGTTFNTGGETAQQFRVPNIANPGTGLQYRIRTGA